MSQRPQLSEIEPKRIALIKPSALGDIMHALPVLAALRQRYPQAHLAWVVNSLYEPLLQQHPLLNATIPFQRRRKGLWSTAVGFTQFLSRLRGEHFDLVIDLQGLFRSGLMAWSTGAARRVGLSSAREGARWFYTDVIDDGGMEDRHAVDRYWRVAEGLGAGSGPKRFVLPVAEAARSWAREVLRDYPRPWLAVGVGARWLTKRWLPEHFAALVNQAQEEYGGTALFVGAPDEVEISRRAWGLVQGPKRDFTGTTDLPQLAALLEQCDAMLANDTGPLHLAVALGRPVVAPYTCTQVKLTGPYGQHERAVETGVWCRGSRLKECPRLECMSELTPARLWPVLESVLTQWRRQRHSA